MGWAGVIPGVIFAIMLVINFEFMPLPEPAWGAVVLRYYGIAMLLCGLLAGVLGVISLVKGERSWLVWLICIFPSPWVVIVLAAELLFPH